ncbi:MAG: NIPSNAP family protein [Proteobacteria bacterium]|nr:NIPSNAP family protein [Burkholderiales bacterium]
MILHEYRIYDFHDAGRARFLALFEEIALPLRRSRPGALLGMWLADRAGVQQLHHLWSYDSFEQRAATRGELATDVTWVETFVQPIVPLIAAQRVALLTPKADWTPVRAPVAQMTTFHCVAFRAASVVAALLAPGTTERMGVWTCESPDPHSVYSLRDAADSDDSVQRSIAGSVRSVARIALAPAPCSPTL